MNLLFTLPGMKIHLQLASKFNVVIGDSGTGKSYLRQLAEDIRDLSPVGEGQPMPICGDDRLVEFWSREFKGALMVIDEGKDLEVWHKLVRSMMESNNYYIICTREGNASIPYGVDTTFVLKRTSNSIRMLPAYTSLPLSKNPVGFSSVLTEDGGVGFRVAQLKSKVPVTPANGKDNLAPVLESMLRRTLVIFDSCGIGASFPSMLRTATNMGAILYDSRSFEYEVLTKVFAMTDTEGYLDHRLQSNSEESYWAKRLALTLNTLYGIGYSKSSDELAHLLVYGKGVVSGRFVDLSTQGYDTSELYPFLEQSDARPASSGLKKLEL